jgi:DNA-binding protein H-NS
MAKSLDQINKQIQALEREAEAIRSKEKSSVLAQIKESMARYGISAAELDLGRNGAASPGKRGPYKKRANGAASAKPIGTAKYRDDAGNAWSGRGPKPKWFKAALAAGKTPDDLRA